MGKRRRSNPNRRQRIGDRDGWICWICHLPVDPALKNPHPHRASLDHIIEKQHGGSDGDHNLRLAHAACNRRRRES